MHGHKKAPGAKARPALGGRESVWLLDEVVGDELGHLEHADGLLAAEDDLQLVVGIDLVFTFLS
jgi:hypothetical protein